MTGIRARLRTNVMLRHSVLHVHRAPSPQRRRRPQAHTFLIALIVLAAPAGAQSAQSAWWKHCTAIRDDRARLACFDTSAPADPPPRAVLPPPPPVMVTASAAPESPRPRAVPRQPRVSNYRVMVGYGLGIGSHAGYFEVDHGALTSTAGIGSDGDTVTAQFWVDHWIGRDWSLGFEYLYINNMSKLILDLPNGVDILTDPLNAHSTLNAHGHLGFVNIAYRPDTRSLLQPYIGGGIGLGWGATNADLGAGNPFLGSYTYTQRAETMFGAFQGFMGIDMSVGPRYYVSAFGKAVWMPGRPFFKIHQRYLDFVLGAGIGRRF
jgi:hypothetical protein